MFNFRPYFPWLRFDIGPAENDPPGLHFNPEAPPGAQSHTFSLAIPADMPGANSRVPVDGDFGGTVGPRVVGGDPLDPFNGKGAASTGPDSGLHNPTSPLIPWVAEPSSLGWGLQDFGRQVQSDTFVPGLRVKPPDDPPDFRVQAPNHPPAFQMAKSGLHSNALSELPEKSGLWSDRYTPDIGAAPPLGFRAGEAMARSDSHVYSAIPPLYDPFFPEPRTDRIKQALDEIGRIYGLDRNRATPPNIVGGPILRPKTQEFSQPIEAYRRRLREVAGKPPITRNGVELVVPRYTYGPRLDDAIGRIDVPPNTDIRGSAIASFGHTGPSAKTAYGTYDTNPALATPFGHTGQRFGAEPGSTYYRRNNPLSLANLSGRATEGNESTRPSMSDAYPEPLISGAQYAQVVVQRNDAVLGNPRIDRTTERLLSILAETVQSLGPGAGPIFGIQAHVEFARRVKELNIPGIRQEGVEQSFSLGEAVRYGLEGSVRTDIVLRDRDDIPIAVYDLKTGNAKLTPSRIQEIRDSLGRPNIPVIELRYRDESAILR